MLEEITYLLRMLGDAAIPDRVIAIIVGAHLDDAMARLLGKHLRGADDKLKAKLLASGSGVLGTFTARVDILRALNLITEEKRHELLKIAKIRNVFAHRLTVDTFDHAQIRDHVDGLKLIEMAEESLRAQGQPGVKREYRDSRRGRFIYSGATLSHNLSFTDVRPGALLTITY